jgi:transposase
LRGRKRHAKTDKTNARHLRALLAEGRLPECWIPSAQILEYRALLETYYDLRRTHTAWVQRIHAVFFHQGAPPLGEGTLRTEQGLAARRATAAAHLSPAGQQQFATALDMLAATEAQLGPLRHQLRDAARHLTGAKVLAERPARSLTGTGGSPDTRHWSRQDGISVVSGLSSSSSSHFTSARRPPARSSQPAVYVSKPPQLSTPEA